MWVRFLMLKNVKSFELATLDFSQTVNLIVGPNNAGKSTILRPILSLQQNLPQLSPEDLRIGATEGEAELKLESLPSDISFESFDRTLFVLSRSRGATGFQGISGDRGGTPQQLRQAVAMEPQNWIYPFLAHRKVSSLSEAVNEQSVFSVPADLQNLNAKIDRLSNPEFQPAHEVYMRACKEVLGFKVTTTHTQQGKRAVYTVQDVDNIPLTAMGDGVMNILGLVVHLAIAKDSLFVLEEPENDIHPRALKALLDLVAEKSDKNQFIITTHSNIVVKKLGALDKAKVFRVDCTLPDRVPTSTITEIGQTPEERREVLQDLGYELHDVDVWDAWLILEESSAEKIIRQYLIPWFVPSLQPRLRTYSAHSISEVAPKFRDFNDLFVFLHLQPAYRNRAWVVVDGGEEEHSVVSGLKSKYEDSGWREEQFRQFSKHDFEEYYPEQFRSKFVEIKSLSDKQARRQKKRELLQEVEQWIASDSEAAKREFQQSASEVIDLLESIEQDLVRPGDPEQVP